MPSNTNQPTDLEQISYQFIKACELGSVRFVKEILHNYPDMPVSYSVVEVLKTVASQSDTALLEYLLKDKKLKPYFYNAIEDAFMAACKAGNLNAIKYLCSSHDLAPFDTPEQTLEDFDNLWPQQISLNCPSQKVVDAFSFVCSYGYKEIVEYILKELPTEQTLSPKQVCEAAFCDCVASAIPQIELASYMLSLTDLSFVPINLDFPIYQKALSFIIKEDNIKSFQIFINPQALKADMPLLQAIDLQKNHTAYSLLRKCFVSDSHLVFRYIIENSNLTEQLADSQVSEMVSLSLISKSKNILLDMIKNNIGNVLSNEDLKLTMKSSNLGRQENISAMIEKKEFDKYFENNEVIQILKQNPKPKKI